jgi:hypothetical protein
VRKGRRGEEEEKGSGRREGDRKEEKGRGRREGERKRKEKDYLMCGFLFYL